MVERKTIYLCLAHMSENKMEEKYVQEAFDTNWVVPMGPNVNAFEIDLANFVNANSDGSKLERKVVCLSAGTAAIHLALIACGVKAGDEVCVQSFTFCASSHPITYLGAKPVFIGSEKDTWNMDPELLEKAILDRKAKTGRYPKAIIPVALYGMPYQIDKIMAIGEKFGIPVIEDAAEGMGSRFNGQVLGTYGKYGILSFNGNKMITTSGGGAVICNGCLTPGPSPEGKGMSLTPGPSPEGKGEAYPRPLPKGKGEAYPQPLPKGKGVYTADPMLYDQLKRFAEDHRKNPTEAELVLWNALKNKGIGYKFRQQHIIEDFIVDFYCSETGLTIEIDGGYHNMPEQMKSDAERTARLKELGFTEIRFTNEQVLCDFDNTIAEILRICKSLPSGGDLEEAQSLPSGGDLEEALSLPSGGDLEGATSEELANEIMWYATQARDAYPYYEHTAIGYNYRMSNVCAGIGRGQMTVLDEHIVHHKHVQALYEELLKDVKGIHMHKAPVHENDNENEKVYDANFWLCAATIDPDVHVKGQENAYKEVIKTAVGGAAGVIHAVESAITDCQPNENVEALRVFMLDKKVECRPLWKPMHKQPVYKNGSNENLHENDKLGCRMIEGPNMVAYTNEVETDLFKIGFCLPAGPCVSDDDVRYIVECIKEAIG